MVKKFNDLGFYITIDEVIETSGGESNGKTSHSKGFN